jgi:GntR family transcriptional regulator/MocR family aminotransferase
MRDWLVHIKRNKDSTLQAQIRQAMVAAVLDGQLAGNEPVPSSRKLAKSLGVSRNTVVLAYQGLLEDGYLDARERSGYFVSERAVEAVKNLPTSKPVVNESSRKPDWAARFNVHPARQENIHKPINWQDYRYPFIYGQVDHTLFPLSDWRDCALQSLGRKWLANWTNDNREEDDPLLIEQIRRRILPRRGIMARDDEILVTLGAQNALYILSALLVNAKSKVAMEEPGYSDIRNIFKLKTDNVALVPLDDEGITLTQEVADSDVVYITPSHQFPTTITMTLNRRMDLLEMAEKNDTILFEDDYEFETNYVNEPCPALKSLDDAGRVVYVGSFSKTLFPGLRLGFMVGPKKLIDEARALRRLMVRHAPNNNQRTAALFLSLGHHDTLIRRLNRAYRARWETMNAALQKHLPGCSEAPSFGGTSFWVRGPDGTDCEDLGMAALDEGVVIEPGRIYFGEQPRPKHYFRLGFSSIGEDRIEDGIEKLAGVMDRL